MQWGQAGRVFHDRGEAGAALAERLRGFAARPDVVVLGLPRGGVPVAAAVAEQLAVPLDVFVVRKLGVPGSPELAMGAIASGGVRVLNDDVVEWYRIRPETIDEAARQQQAELDRRERLYRDGRPFVPVAGRTVLLIDDGLATGATMSAAVKAVRALGPARIVVAVPVGAADTCRHLTAIADEVICLEMPEPFEAVGQWYEDFAQTSDQEVRAWLASASRRTRKEDSDA